MAMFVVLQTFKEAFFSPVLLCHLFASSHLTNLKLKERRKNYFNILSLSYFSSLKFTQVTYPLGFP
jgi:hypothetical protein